MQLDYTKTNALVIIRVTTYVAHNPKKLNTTTSCFKEMFKGSSDQFSDLIKDASFRPWEYFTCFSFVTKHGVDCLFRCCLFVCC